MIWLIAKHTALKNLYDYRFVILYVVAIVMMALSAVMSSHDLEQTLTHYNRLRNLAAREANLDKVIVVKPPSPLRFIHTDVDDQLPDYLVISPGFADYPVEDVQLKPLSQIGEHLDWTFLFTYLFSILGLLLTFDLVSGETERGTLKLVLSFGPSRSDYLMGSLVGTLLTILPIIFIGCALNLLIISLNAPLTRDQEWEKIGSAILISSLLTVVLMAIGLAASTLSVKSSTSFLLALMVWVMLVIVIPIGSVLVAQQVVTIPTATELEAEIQRARQLFFAQLYPLSSEELREIDERNDLTDAEKRQKVAELQEMIDRQDLAALARYHKRLIDIRESYLKQLLRQVEVANAIARISPIAAYREAMSAITGTGLPAQKFFYERAKQYMHSYTSYVTPLREKLRHRAEIEGIRIMDRGYEIRDVQAISWKNVEFDRNSLPRFEAGEMPISTALRLSLRGVGFLVASIALALLLSYFKFVRYPVA